MRAESANFGGAIPSTEIQPIAIVDVVSRSIPTATSGVLNFEILRI